MNSTVIEGVMQITEKLLYASPRSNDASCSPGMNRTVFTFS